MSVTADIISTQQPGTRALLLRAARAAGIGSLAGALAGVVWGVLARGAMRIIALAMYHYPSFSLEGTLMIVVLGVITGSIVGVIYAGLRWMLPWRRAWKGLTLCIALLLTLGALLYGGPLVQEGSRAVRPLATALFAASLVIWGALIELLYQPLDRRLLNGRQGRAAAIASAILLALPPLLAVAMFSAQALGVFEE
jgi:hypothetical protein